MFDKNFLALGVSRKTKAMPRSYAHDWRIAGGADLSAMVRDYVRELVAPAGVSFLTWSRSGACYSKAAEAMSAMWGSMVADAGITLDIPRTLGSDAQKEAYIRNLLRPDSRQPDIRRVYRKARAAAGDRKKRVFVISLNSFWFDGEAKGHAQMIVVDFRHKTQVFFDPHGVVARLFFRELARVPPIVPGHTNVAPDDALGYRLQGHLESELEREQSGTCGLTTLLTLLCCRRFNYWHMPTITEAIHDAFPSAIEANVVMQSLIHLYESRVLSLNLSTATLTREQEEALFATLFPDEGRCRVYSDSSGRFCSRKACRMGPALSLCWQHRHYLQSPYVQSKKCAAAFR